MLVGGYAVGWHGVVRATGAIDFLYEQKADNVARLCAAVRDFGAPEHLIDPKFLMSPNAVTQIGRAPLRIDLLAAITGVAFDEVRAGADEVELDGQRLFIIGINELRTNKRARGAPRTRKTFVALTLCPEPLVGGLVTRRSSRPRKARRGHVGVGRRTGRREGAVHHPLSSTIRPRPPIGTPHAYVCPLPAT